ncbi:unnamed protein product, partial [Closterium sp. Naga37s-1]
GYEQQFILWRTSRLMVCAQQPQNLEPLSQYSGWQHAGDVDFTHQPHCSQRQPQPTQRINFRRARRRHFSSSALDGNFEDLPSFYFNDIRYLDLSYNEFESAVPWHVTLMSRLEHLDLRGNTIVVPLPDAISNLQSLSFL